MAVMTISVPACAPDSDASRTAAQVEASLNAGIAALERGDVEFAEGEFDNVLRLDAFNKYAMYNLGLVAQQRGEVTESADWYRRALAIDPRFVSALYNLAVLRAPVATHEALDLYEILIEIEPANAAARLNLSFLLRQFGEAVRADEELALALELDPSLAAGAADQPPLLGGVE